MNLQKIKPMDYIMAILILGTTIFILNLYGYYYDDSVIMRNYGAILISVAISYLLLRLVYKKH